MPTLLCKCHVKSAKIRLKLLNFITAHTIPIFAAAALPQGLAVDCAVPL